MKNIIINDIKKTFTKYAVIMKKAPWFLGRHAFAFILLFILLGLVVAMVIFYQYLFLPNITPIEVDNTPAAFQENTYRSLQEEWDRREAAVESFTKEKYNNPF